MGHDTGKTCRCIATHRPAPLELEKHHIWPLGMGGPDTADNIEWLCPTTHTNAHELLRAMVKIQQILPFQHFVDLYEQPVSRHAYEVACEGFRRWQAAAS